MTPENLENLELVVRWRENGLAGQPVRVRANPDDTKELLRHLEELARRWHNRDASTRWLDEYELHVRSLERTWLDFTVSGLGQKL